jgi:cytochrome c
MAEQGQVMVQHGEELIRQGQMMKEEGQKWIQQSGKAGASTEAKAPIIQTTTQTTTMPTTPPANPSKPGQLMQNSSQYQEYVKQGQQLWKETKQMIPSSKK